jgi:RNA polymerase sigma-70 factor (ECF subfamily)
MESTAALERLCGSYWMPAYAFIRWRGHSPHDAEDLTQDFFAELLNRRDFSSLDRSQGKFRCFLIACLKHFLAKDWRERNALKRGGGRKFVSIDGVEAEERYASDLASNSDVNVLFDRRWAMGILDHALTSLREEQVAARKGELFSELQHFLMSGAVAETGYKEIGERLQMTPGAVATAVHRLRQRYGELVRSAVAQTVTTPLELEEEMRHLMAVLSQ